MPPETETEFETEQEEKPTKQKSDPLHEGALKFLKTKLKEIAPTQSQIVIKTVVPGHNYRVNFISSIKNADDVISRNSIVKSIFVKVIKTGNSFDYIDKTVEDKPSTKF